MATKNKELDDFFSKIIKRVPGLEFVFLSDVDGVLISQAESDSESKPSGHLLASTCALAAEHASKLSFGSNEFMINFYKSSTYFHLSFKPLIITFQGTKDLNVGVLIHLLPSIKAALSPLQKAISSSRLDDE